MYPKRYIIASKRSGKNGRPGGIPAHTRCRFTEPGDRLALFQEYDSPCKSVYAGSIPTPASTKLQSKSAGRMERADPQHGAERPFHAVPRHSRPGPQKNPTFFSEYETSRFFVC